MEAPEITELRERIAALERKIQDQAAMTTLLMALSKLEIAPHYADIQQAIDALHYVDADVKLKAKTLVRVYFPA
jgi:hypothetical protein